MGEMARHHRRAILVVVHAWNVLGIVNLPRQDVAKGTTLVDCQEHDCDISVFPTGANTVDSARLISHAAKRCGGLHTNQLYDRMLKGIILAGGSGSRLLPATLGTNKQLIPVYDKPMVYYPMATLMLAGIRDILVISTPTDLPRFRSMFGDGRQLGLRLEYAEQAAPNGLAEAFIVGRQFIGSDRCALILGDNIFFGGGLLKTLSSCAANEVGATVLAYYVRDPERYGVVELGHEGEVLSLEEKPASPRSHLAVTGLYFYDNSVLDIAAGLTPSGRGELEITDVNREYLRRGQLNVVTLGRGMAWLDTGTPASLLSAANFVAAVEERQGLRIGAIEEVAYRMGLIDATQLAALAAAFRGNDYGCYLAEIARDSLMPR